MKRWCILLLSTLLWSNNLVEKSVQIEADLFAKIILLDYDTPKKLVDGELLVTILYDTPAHLAIARQFAQSWHNKHYLHFTIRTHLINIKKTKEIPPSTAYLAILSAHTLKTILPHIVKMKRLLFVYDNKKIEDAMIAVEFGLRVRPLINGAILKRAKIRMRPIIFKVAKVYDEDCQ